MRQGRLAVTSFFSLSREGIVFSFSACGQYLRKESGALNYYGSSDTLREKLQDLDDLSATVPNDNAQLLHQLSVQLGLPW